MQVYIVTGGFGPIGSGNFLDSTELYNSNLGSWNYGARLPKAMQSLRGSNIDGRILIFGMMILKVDEMKGLPNIFRWLL